MNPRGQSKYLLPTVKKIYVNIKPLTAFSHTLIFTFQNHEKSFNLFALEVANKNQVKYKKVINFQPRVHMREEKFSENLFVLIKS